MGEYGMFAQIHLESTVGRVPATWRSLGTEAQHTVGVQRGDHEAVSPLGII